MINQNLSEAISLLSDHNDINAEILTATSNIQDILNRKYISRLHSIIDESREVAERYPSKEVVLLKALKGFSKEQNLQNIDRIINTLNFASTINNINHSLDPFSEASVSTMSKSSPSFSLCSANIMKILLLLALTGKI